MARARAKAGIHSRLLTPPDPAQNDPLCGRLWPPCSDALAVQISGSVRVVPDKG